MVDGSLRVEGETYSSDSLSDVIDPIVHSKRTKTKNNWSVSGNVFDKKTGKWVRPRHGGDKIRFARDMWRNPTAYSVSLVEGDISHASGFVRQPTGPYPDSYTDYNGDLPTSTFGLKAPAVGNYDPTLEQRAVVKALMKLKDQKVNLAVAFGERVETAELLLGTVQTLHRFASALKKGDIKKAAKALRIPTGSLEKGIHRKGKKGLVGQSFHEQFLSVQYGWKPLMQDVYGAAAALHNRDQSQQKRYSACAKGLIRLDGDFTSTAYYNYGYGASYQRSRKEIAFVRLDYFLENPLLQSLSSLGILNPVEVAWELVPFSFVADWFLPIGNYLSCMDAAVGWQFRAGSLTRAIHETWRANLFPRAQPGFANISKANGVAFVRSVKMDRTVYGSSPLPRIPSLKNPFPKGNSSHIANAIALLAANLR